MLVVATILTVIYALINAFGAWAVVRRKPWLAALFMLAAAVLVVAAAAFLYKLPYTQTLLASGLILASLASFLNAYLVLGEVVWRFHVIRAVAAVLIYVVAYYGLR